MAQLSDEKFLPNITPPSLAAYSLGKFGNLEIGEFTGSPNINIPLLKFKGNSLEMDLLLSYTSPGIKVDEKDGYFGLGWTLIAGGVINRIVRGKNDFVNKKLAPPDNFDNGVYDPKVAQFFYDAANGNNDTEADLFSFNTGDINGQFVINNQGQITLLSKDNIKFQILYDMEHKPYFVMKDSKGVTYYFTAIEEIFTRVSGGSSHVPPSPTSITAWFLTKKENVDGEQIIFEYEEDIQRYILSHSQTLSYSSPFIQLDCEYDDQGLAITKNYSKAPTLGSILSNETNNFGKRLKRILSNRNTAKIELDYNNGVIMTHYNNSNIIEKLNFQIDKTLNERLFLNSIISLTKAKDYKFEYIQPAAFPPRLSFSQDHWGYFNGKFNTNIVPKNLKYLLNLNTINYNGADKQPDHTKSVYGALNKVIYPTKGFTTIEYEPNSYYGTEIVYPNPKNIHEGLVVAKNQRQITKTFTIQAPISQEIKIQGYGNFNSIDCENSLNLGSRHRIDFSVMDLQTNQIVNLNGKDSQGNPMGSYSDVSFSDGNTSYYYLKTEPGKSYEFKLFANWNCTNGSVGLSYYDQPPTEVTKNILTGGNRVVKMIDFEENGQFIKRYYYAPKNNLNQSSGEKGADPNYFDFRKWETGCIDLTVLKDAIISSSSIIPLFDSGKSNVYYKYVTVSLGGDNFEKGGVEKEYIVNKDYSGNQLFGSENVGSAPWTNFGWNNGYLKTEKFFDNTGKTLKANDYLWEKKNITNNKSYYIRKNYNQKAPRNPVYTCSNEDVNRDNNGTYWVCTTNHTHFILVGSGKCTLPNSNNIEKKYSNPCYQKPLGYQLVHQYAIENLDIVEYDNISYQKYLKTVTSTDYMNNQPMKSTVTENSYDSNLHYQLTKEIKTYPDKKIVETNTGYAHEKGNQKLINANMIGIPLETTVVQKQNVSDSNGKIILKTETKYDDPATLFPTSTLSYDLQNSNPITEVTYDQYDSNGNLQQYTSKDKISTVIIWGYNNTKPIAKIEDIKLTAIQQSYITTIVNASNTDAAAGTNNDESSLLSAFTTFRGQLPNHQITTYSYDPLIGVRSITPPSGIREVYLYDSAGRLKEIRENNQTGRLVKEFKYNYKN
ncbi:hypothetical protein DRF67_00020 [Chryseobacterium pennipullorum]|uniref:YD repeat-containing protein n=1 Tax=Chryseobacterium pennipullorum TaxID=2258963 RepID=A0A3D9BA24_9FLAO|nr:hypothetical protein DRF67_00020 [Chryseobacterium pennipullorum]